LTHVNRTVPALDDTGTVILFAHRSNRRRVASRRWTAFAVIFSLLWLQLAVAAYACPAQAAHAVAAEAAHAVAARATHDCGGDAATVIVDADNPNLCLQHMLQGSQHADSKAAPALPSLAAIAPLAVDVVRPANVTPRLALLERERLRAPDPPKAIAHCCFRI